MQTAQPNPARRFSTQEMAQIEIYGKDGKLLTKMGNVSYTGAFFEVISSNFVPQKEDLVRITVNLRSVNKTHVIDAEVVWSKGLGVGVQFLNRDQMNSRISSQLSKKNKHLN